MNKFQIDAPDIYRLKIPFEDLYTSVFLIALENSTVLMDCATTSFDVDNFIIPALKDLGYDINSVDALVLTHRHTDHSGGLNRILEHAPNMRVITDVTPINGEISIYPLHGHTRNCIGVFDSRSKTLISGDGIQGAGIGKYRCYTEDLSAYLKTLDRIKNDTKIECILFSHAYEPWYKDSVHGRKNILSCLEDCKKYVDERKK